VPWDQVRRHMQSVHGNGHWSGQVRLGQALSPRVGNTAGRIVLQWGAPYLAAATVAVVSNFSPAIMLARREGRMDRGWKPRAGSSKAIEKALPLPPRSWRGSRGAQRLTCGCLDDDAIEHALALLRERRNRPLRARVRLAIVLPIVAWWFSGNAALARAAEEAGGVRLSGRTPWRADWRRARPCRAGIGSWLFLCSARSCETISL